MSTSLPKTINGNNILAIVLIYAIFAGLWILLSDKLVQFLFSSPEQIILASMLKGWLFVGVSSLLLYNLMRRWVESDSRQPTQTMPIMRWRLPFILLALIVIALTGIAISRTINQHKQTELARLQAITDLKTRQINDWLQERHENAEFVKNNDFLADQYHAWQNLHNMRSGEQLKNRLDQFNQNKHFNAITLLDANGEKRWGSTKSPPIFAPALQSGIDAAIKNQTILTVGPYRGVRGNLRFDIITPLVARPAPYPFVVLHVDLADWLIPSLKTWPVPSASGEMVLFRRDGDQIVFLNELRHQEDSAAKLRLPLSTEKLLSAQVLRGETELGSPVEGID